MTESRQGHKIGHYFFGSRLFEGDFKFVAIDRFDSAITKFLMEHPLAQLQALALFAVAR